MRTIDADALIEKCGDWYVEEGTESGFIGTLKNLLATMPTIQPEKAQLSQEGTTKDTISRQAVIDEIKSVYEWHDTVTMERLIEHLNNLPPIQPERKKEEWSDGYRWQWCSLCKQTGKKSWNFCPNCGADMRGEQNETY